MVGKGLRIYWPNEIDGDEKSSSAAADLMSLLAGFFPPLKKNAACSNWVTVVLAWFNSGKTLLLLPENKSACGGGLLFCSCRAPKVCTWVVVLLQNCTWVVAKTGGLPLFKSFLAPVPLFNLPISTPPPSTTTEDAELKDINADPPPPDLNSDSPDPQILLRSRKDCFPLQNNSDYPQQQPNWSTEQTTT